MADSKAAKYTPGPWVATRRYVIRKDEPDLVIRAAGGDRLQVADVSFSDDPTHTFCTTDVEVMRANANLIAAAPDLLDTLRWLDSIGGLGHAAHERIRAAIAKATGEQQ